MGARRLGLRARVARWVGVLAPRGWRDFALQVGLLGSFELVYALSGLYGRHEAGQAVANARGLVGLERRLGIAWEHGVQSWVLHGPHVLLEVANRTYFSSQFAVSTLFLFWVYARRNAQFARVRNALLAANYVSVIVLVAYPLAPPRMVPGGGFVDTLAENGVNLHSRVIDLLNNPYSAMPSLHASYALVLAIAGVALTRRLWAKLAWALYPCLVAFSVVASGNHFVLDVVAGALALLATPLVVWAGGRVAIGTNRIGAVQVSTEQRGA
jgi:membrane-associated phospholipid phosphatase